MLIINFAWTDPAFKARRKRCTRRDWNERYARLFHKGDLVQAWNKNPRNGGKRVGTIRLTADPYRELSEAVPAEDWENEGFAYMTEIGKGESTRRIWEGWKHNDIRVLWVVRFEIVEVYA